MNVHTITVDGNLPDPNTGDVVSGYYKSYVAALTQVGTDAPVATIFKNTLGILPVWYRNFAGDYKVSDDITTEGAFTIGKTVVFCTSGLAGTLIAADSSTNSAVYIYTSDSTDGNKYDNLMTTSFIEIRVYQ